MTTELVLCMGTRHVAAPRDHLPQHNQLAPCITSTVRNSIRNSYSRGSRYIYSLLEKQLFFVTHPAQLYLVVERIPSAVFSSFINRVLFTIFSSKQKNVFAK